MATQTRRKASDALAGAAVPVEETAAPAGDAAPAQSIFDGVLAPAGDSVKESKDAAPAADVVTTKETPAPEVEPDTEGDGDAEAPEFEDVEAVVVIDLFSYFDADGSHTTANKGTVLSLDAETASRGFRIGALAPKD